MSNFRHPAQRIPNKLRGHFISVRYKGCADRWRWRGLDISYQGCRYQDYLGWNNRRTLWCFCDYEFCNRVRETDFNDARFTKKGDSIQQDSKGQGGSQETDNSPNWPFSISLCEFPNLLLTGSIVMSKIVNVEPKFKAFITFLSVSF